jgi:ATP-binding cassette subfamily C (CFTR/MRP) protein 10
MKDNAVAWSGLTSKFLEDDTVRETHAPWLKLEDTKQDEATDGAKPKGEPLPDGGTAKDTVADAEEKTSGDAQLQVLTFYGRQTGGPVQHTMTVGLVVLLLGARTMSQYWFVWWTDDRLHLPSHIYLIVYLCLVVAQAFTTSE